VHELEELAAEEVGVERVGVVIVVRRSEETVKSLLAKSLTSKSVSKERESASESAV
jgi:hypothetical protein